MSPPLPCIPYTQLVQICGEARPLLPYYAVIERLVYCYVPTGTTVVQLGEIWAQVQRRYPGATYQLVFVAQVPGDRLAPGWHDAAP